MSVKIIEAESSVTTIKVLEVNSIRSSARRKVGSAIMWGVSIIIRVVPVIILRFSLRHENTVTSRER
jgi:hypothetical protein